VSNNGTASWTGLPYGNYHIVEDFNGITTNVYTYTVSNPVKNITVNGAETDTIANTPEKGSITVRKSGLEGSDTAIFSLTGPAGTGPFDDVILDNKSGSGYPSSGGWSNLPYGQYTVTEKWGEGNVYTYNTTLSPNPKTVTVNGNEDICVTNCAEKYSVTVNKSGLEWGYWWADEATFTLTGPEGLNSDVRSVVLDNFWWNDYWGGPYSSKTWTGLPPGEYTLTESYPGDNSITYTSNITFPQEFDLGPDKTFDVVNTSIEEIEGDITLNKTGLGELPAGVQAGFTLLDKDKKYK